MTREEKAIAIAELKEDLGNASFIYLADSSTMTVARINNFRRLCFQKGVQVKVAKNTLIKKALEEQDAEKGFEALYDSLKGQTTLLISDNPKAPAELLKEFRETDERPLLKAAYIDSDVFVGDDKIKELTKLKSKEELLSDIIGLLLSPAKNIATQLDTPGSKLASLVQVLAEREGGEE